ncbi:MAG: hypothetical protein SFX18_07485 [Pirellulales bacterium]|nr:hypothetical protein [Pirellulales bacterium]
MQFTTAELEGYLDETLAPEKMAAIELALRAQPHWLPELQRIVQRRDAGVHSVAEIWRRARLTCASRADLSQLLLGILDEDRADYLWFHIQTIGCRYCAANLADLQSQQAEAVEQTTFRRRKYYESSAGLLRKR